MVKPASYIIGFVKATTAQILAALNGLAGNFGYDFTQKRFFGTHDDGENPKYFATLEDLAGISVADASETVEGVVEIADSTEFAAGTDVGATGAPLSAKVSDIRNALDTKVQIGEDLENTIDAPRVKSSTTASALFLIKNIANTVNGAIKAVAGVLQFRTGDDTALTNIEAQNATFAGDVTITGNLTISGSQTQVNTTQVVATDNLITLNSGEVGAGVTAGKSGFEVDRGSETDAELVWDETDDKYKAGIQGATKVIATGHSEVITAAAALQHVITHGLNSLSYVAKNIIEASGIEEDAIFETIDANSVRVNYLVPTTDRRIVILAL